MAEHFVRVVEDGTLPTDDGWALARFDDGNFLFAVEKTAATRAEVLNDAWRAAAQLEIEQAVRDGIVEYTERPRPRAV